VSNASLRLSILAVVSLAIPALMGAEDWPQFRGPGGRAVSASAEPLGELKLGEPILAIPALMDRTLQIRTAPACAAIR
jgi:hypothetical protein